MVCSRINHVTRVTTQAPKHFHMSNVKSW